MKRDVTRRALVGAGLSALGGAAFAAPLERALRPLSRPIAGSGAALADPSWDGEGPRARATLEAMVREANLGGDVGFVVADARTGQHRAERLADTPLPPASTAKALTALYALRLLGPDHRFATRVLTTGRLDADGTLDGDVILAGGGDPLLDTSDLSALAAQLRDSGVRAVAGRFLVWGSALPNVRKISEDQADHLGYNPAVSGLNLNFNRVHFGWERSGNGYAVSMDARIGTLRPEVGVARIRIADRSLPVYTYADQDGVDEWTVARAALGNAGARWLPVRRPELYAGDVFRTLARNLQITLPPAQIWQDALPAGAEVARHDSAPMDDIVRGMLLYSTNLTAEVLGLAASSALGTAPSSLQASASRMSDWLRRELGSGALLRDHSGLSDESLVSAGDMVAALVSAGPMSPVRELLKDIPLTDPSGAALRFSRGEVEAKTGTLNFVSALAGYHRSVEGEDLVFAILCANRELREDGKASGDEIPAGARPWNRRARRLQQRLLQRWGLIAV